MDIKKLSTLKYWTSFYKRWTTLKGSTSFDWLTDFNNVQDSLQPLLPSKSFNYLDMGCGISNFTAQLLRNSSYDIHAVCVDYTKDALITQRKLLQQIDLSNNNCGAVHQVSFLHLDVRRLPFNSDCFDIILDKGTTDSMLKDTELGVSNAIEVINNAVFCLNDKGYLIQITDEDPDLRMDLLQNALKNTDVSLSFKIIPPKSSSPQQMEYFMYIIRKNS